MSVNDCFSRLEHGAKRGKPQRGNPNQPVGLTPTTRGSRLEMTGFASKSLITLPKNYDKQGYMGRTFLISDSFVS